MIKPTLPEKIAIAAPETFLFGEVYERSEIVNLIHSKTGISKDSFLPSDYCYNSYNHGLGDFSKWPHLFEKVERGKFKYLGLNYPYTGDVTWVTKINNDKVTLIYGYYDKGVFTANKMSHIHETIPHMPSQLHNIKSTANTHSINVPSVTQNIKQTSTVLMNVIENYPDALNDKQKFRALLMDYFPKNLQERNLLQMAYDEDIPNQLKQNGSLDKLSLSRYARNIESNYGVSDERAQIAVLTWAYALGVLVE